MNPKVFQVFQGRVRRGLRRKKVVNAAKCWCFTWHFDDDWDEEALNKSSLPAACSLEKWWVEKSALLLGGSTSRATC